MKRILQPFLSSLMALLVLASTISWTVDKHLCMGRVLDISLFSHAEACGMEGNDSRSKGEDPRNGCCDDERFTLVGQDVLKHSWKDLDLDLESQFFPMAVPQLPIQGFVPMEGLPLAGEHYPPPLLVRDIQIGRAHV